VFLQLVGFQVDFCIEDNEFLLQTWRIRTHEMILPVMQRQTVIVNIVLRLTASPIANKAPFMFLPTMNIQLIIPVEPLSAESAFWMAFETTLINSPGIIIAFPHVLL
jgi:hypothetical protein